MNTNKDNDRLLKWSAKEYKKKFKKEMCKYNIEEGLLSAPTDNPKEVFVSGLIYTEALEREKRARRRAKRLDKKRGKIPINPEHQKLSTNARERVWQKRVFKMKCEWCKSRNDMRVESDCDVCSDAHLFCTIKEYERKHPDAQGLHQVFRKGNKITLRKFKGVREGDDADGDVEIVSVPFFRIGKKLLRHCDWVDALVDTEIERMKKR